MTSTPEVSLSEERQKRAMVISDLRALNSPYRKVSALRKFHNAAADLIEALDRELAACDADWRKRGEIIREQREQLKAFPSEREESVCYVPCKAHEGLSWTMRIGTAKAIKTVCPICEPPKSDLSEDQALKTVRQCDYCGDEIPACERWGRIPVTCGKAECERWARDEEAMEREEAHRRLDDEMGYDKF